MNCKPADLARVIDAPDTREADIVDKIVRLVSTYQWRGMVMWEYEGPKIQTPLGPVIGIADELLRPIRDPGDDAVDESRAWLPPVPQEVTA